MNTLSHVSKPLPIPAKQTTKNAKVSTTLVLPHADADTMKQLLHASTQCPSLVPICEAVCTAAHNEMRSLVDQYLADKTALAQLVHHVVALNDLEEQVATIKRHSHIFEK
jgi:hypothetical protein